MTHSTLFDTIVAAALAERPELGALRPVVEKELLHHDILRYLAHSGTLQHLVFMGGTCLRICYGSPRLSEDLDFTTDLPVDEIPHVLSDFSEGIRLALDRKYRLPVAVTPPQREAGNVRTWKVRLTTRPQRPDLPAQRIHVDVQALPARDAQSRLVRNPYRIDMGTSGLLIQASSTAEILADKFIALALRPNRIKWRDVWDIVWLLQRDTPLSRSLLARKAEDRATNTQTIVDQITDRLTSEDTPPSGFIQELQRFLPTGELRTTIAEPKYWIAVSDMILSEIHRK